MIKLSKAERITNVMPHALAKIAPDRLPKAINDFKSVIAKVVDVISDSASDEEIVKAIIKEVEND